MHRTAIALCTIALLSFTAIGCGDDADDPEVWIGAACQKMDECDLLSNPLVQAMFGSNKGECENKMKDVIKNDPSQDPDPTSDGCTVADPDQCLADFRAQSCTDFQNQVEPDSCKCE